MKQILSGTLRACTFVVYQTSEARFKVVIFRDSDPIEEIKDLTRRQVFPTLEVRKHL